MPSTCTQCGKVMGRMDRPTPIVGVPGAVVCGHQCVGRYRAHERHLRRVKLGIALSWDEGAGDPPYASGADR